MKERLVHDILKEYKGILYLTGGIERIEFYRFFRSSRKLFTKSELITHNSRIHIFYILIHKKKLVQKSYFKLLVLLRQMKKFHRFAKENYYCIK